VRSVSQESFD